MVCHQIWLALFNDTPLHVDQELVQGLSSVVLQYISTQFIRQVVYDCIYIGVLFFLYFLFIYRYHSFNSIQLKKVFIAILHELCTLT